MKFNHKYFVPKRERESLLYIIIIILWLIISLFSIWFLIVFQWHNTLNSKQPIVAQVFLIINWFFIDVLYCNGIKDFMFVLTYYFFLKNKKYRIDYLDNDITNKKVIILYTTCNDFDAKALLACMKQNYSNFETFILDDSYEESFKNEIDKFAQLHRNVKVIRRKDRKGFKAGNINNFLKNKKDYDYFVLLDSDEIIPCNFIEKTIIYFKDKSVGIVQANHEAKRVTNIFNFMGSKGVVSAWTTFISVKNYFGSVTLNGHGAMISKECYLDSGGFPEIVAEDLGLTLSALNAGYKSVFAKEILCDEMFPIDYLAFKKRNIKWTQGNFEFFKKVGGWKIWKLKIPFHQKIDLWMSSTSLSLTVFSLFATLINFTILYPIGFKYNFIYLIWIFIIILTITPMLNDIIYYFGKINFFILLLKLFFDYLLYPSMMVSSLSTLLLSIFGKKAKFIITPKNEKKYNLWDCIKYNWKELFIALLSTIILPIIFIFVHEYRYIFLIWYILFVLPLIGTIPLTLMSNIKVYKRNLKPKKIRGKIKWK